MGSWDRNFGDYRPSASKYQKEPAQKRAQNRHGNRDLEHLGGWLYAMPAPFPQLNPDQRQIDHHEHRQDELGGGARQPRNVKAKRQEGDKNRYDRCCDDRCET